MTKFDCFLNKETKKISYPDLVYIEPLFGNKLKALALFTPEVKAGELIVVEYFNSAILRIYKIDDENIEQIYGEPSFTLENVTLKVLFLKKREKIEEYITNLYGSLPLSSLIDFRHDLNSLEKELIKYFLLCKSENKVVFKSLRSVVFKNCKSSKLSENICSYLKKKPFDYYKHDWSIIKLNFENWTVQFENE
jgi:hypothetical protein